MIAEIQRRFDDAKFYEKPGEWLKEQKRLKTPKWIYSGEVEPKGIQSSLGF